jgi:replicative superfamily II helicase
MTLYARFVGINKYQSNQIPDLNGAVRDATALWALFKDTFPTIDAELIIDENATVNSVKTALLETLMRATEEDEVILSFAGHGTRDHRIVTHDTQISQIDATSISMATLADCFRLTRAKSVICILDCCFSGAAPARVLDPIPGSRTIPFEEAAISGKGKVLITASGLKEPAYEHPIHRHGLLTHAIIHVLTSTQGEVTLLSVMDQVLEKVRTDIASLGRRQTPESFNLVVGDLRISSLKPGPLYRSYFPEKGGIQISSEISDLSAFGLPDSVLKAWKGNFSSGLNDLQVKAINDYRILDGESLIVVAPTSSGKTFVGELAAVKAIIEGRKAVFLLPYKALVNEKYDSFISIYGSQLKMRVIRCTGDYMDDTSAFILGKYDIALLTYEMFLSLAISNTAALCRIGLVVLDEAQFITDENRGIVVELILTRLKTAKNEGILPQLIALSATIGDINKFDDWLGIKSYITNVRPVPLEMGVLDRSGAFDLLDSDGNQKTIQLIPAGNIYMRGQKPSAQDVIIPLTRQLIEDVDKREKILIFRNMKGSAEGCAEYLARDLMLPAATESMDDLPIHDRSSSSGRLRNALQGGVALHNSNLSREERVLVERSFRDPEGKIRVLVATTTVAAGINTPASTVIIVEHDFPWENRSFTIADVKNMAGRAGRLGYREVGRAILLADNAFERHQLFQKYVLGIPEAICSSLKTDQIGTWLFRLLSHVVKKIKAEELILLVTNTYGGFLATLHDADWQVRTQSYLEQLLPRMKNAGLLEEEDDNIKLSLLGKVCSESSLSLESIIRFIHLLKQTGFEASTPKHLMAFIQALPELDEQYIPYFKKGQREMIWPNELASVLGRAVSQSLQQGADDMIVYCKRAKRSCVLLDWIEGKSIESMETRFSVNPFNSVGAGDIRSVVDTTRFHLRSVFNIATVLIPGLYQDPIDFEHILQQLEFGIPANLLPLLEMPIRLSRGEYLILGANNITTADAFLNLPTSIMVELFGEQRANGIEVIKRSII